MDKTIDNKVQLCNDKKVSYRVNSIAILFGCIRGAMKNCIANLSILVACVIMLFLPLTTNSQEEERQQTFEKVNINTATVEELASLPKISKRNAKSIVKYREKYGPFKTIEDVAKAPGIDMSEYRAIKDMITVK